ncbi:MAG: hypothetical protein Harvfovirus3_5 [Harvfovirus sp.]|uniref:Leucine-rich repeat protein n=1 Tax=Harvfovirus sp. TaxID=2487768 RepID=A0A3G5A0A3_9VIRU|nr:MAG: hypothetical protein Harvfovirus3_5 [Harvfovirus sp.]
MNQKILWIPLTILTSYLDIDSLKNLSFSHEYFLKYAYSMKNIEMKITTEKEGSDLIKIFKNIKLCYKVRYDQKVTDALLDNITSIDISSIYLIDRTILMKLPNLHKLTTCYQNHITNADITHLRKLKKLETRSYNITDSGISILTNLEELNISNNLTITGNCFSQLPKLTKLNIKSTAKICDHHISNLTNLKSLNLSKNDNITDLAIHNLLNLTELNISSTYRIKGNNLSVLTNLKNLYCGDHNVENYNIKNLLSLTSLNCVFSNLPSEQYSSLTNLESLFVLGGKYINKSLIHLINLTTLSVSNSASNDLTLGSLTNLKQLSFSHYYDKTQNITSQINNILTKLTNLTLLNIPNNQDITDDAIINLTRLNILDVSRTKQITNRSIEKLLNLAHLDLERTERVTDEAISKLTKLTFLNVKQNNKITIDSIKNLSRLNWLGTDDKDIFKGRRDITVIRTSEDEIDDDS